VANVSNWKGWEWEVAIALGGKRRLRTMESFGVEAPDVYFGKKFRRKYPLVRTVVIECKKRRNLSVPALFAGAASKYGEGGKKHVLLGTKLPRLGSLGKKTKELKKEVANRYSEGSRIWEKRYSLLLRQRQKEPRKKDIKRLRKSMRRAQDRVLKRDLAKLRARHSITGLMTVELGFFTELWEAWIGKREKEARAEKKANGRHGG